MIAIKKGAAPQILRKKGKELTEKLKTDFNNGIRKFDFDSAVYGGKSVKSLLLSEAIQNDKYLYTRPTTTLLTICILSKNL
jgi:hypothetical protein